MNKKNISFQIKKILWAIVFSYLITYGVGFLALGIGGDENLDNGVVKVIQFVRRNETAFVYNPINQPKSHLRSDNPQEWATIDAGRTSALRKDIFMNTIYIYFLGLIITYLLHLFRKDNNPSSNIVH